MNTPIVALIGQPNVGKSSFFNLLAGKRSAIVSAKAGVTRDRQFSKIQLDNVPLWLVDTAGLSRHQDKLSSAMYEQSRMAAAQADLVILMTDGSTMCQSEDIELARFIQKSKTKVLLAVNKHDLADPNDLETYRKIGMKEIFSISCMNKHGIDALKSAILENITHVEEEIQTDTPIVSIVGKPNAGKSTLSNHYAKEDRCIVSKIPGTTRDAIAIDLEHNKTPYRLIDTAGMRKKARIHEEIEQYATSTTLRAIDEAHTVIHLIDATEHIARQDFRIIHLCLDMGKAVVIGVNKIDCLSKSAKALFKKDLSIALKHLKQVPIVELSATQGKNTYQLMTQAITLAKGMNRTFNTSMLTRVLEKLVKRTPPPTRLGRPIQLRMAHTSKQYPLQITIRGKRTSYLPKSYIRYLTNGFLQELQLTGRHIHLVLESDHNPFAPE
ncbi:ribosome biogenesis GTPase Der [Candidatus Synchoanobacter obligatus]|uniref:GTPase Der n=1 Tax=Candidatus Synchoanobacter obligatus TaxID=2919597 RepID=A0ABT1L4H8_9GAMM|nr:ribosome biogenesis GTPase Der [Candidatus Synchoanobacter obligatus]MCP8351861.1 ribosome biogenesis GTPase Der [Candidatus Synchoanobacter obligatus]